MADVRIVSTTPCDCCGPTPGPDKLYVPIFGDVTGAWFASFSAAQAAMARVTLPNARIGCLAWATQFGCDPSVFGPQCEDALLWNLTPGPTSLSISKGANGGEFFFGFNANAGTIVSYSWPIYTSGFMLMQIFKSDQSNVQYIPSIAVNPGPGVFNPLPVTGRYVMRVSVAVGIAAATFAGSLGFSIPVTFNTTRFLYNQGGPIPGYIDCV